MTIREVYERYKHLDALLSDEAKGTRRDQVLYDLWQAVKQEVEGQEQIPNGIVAVAEILKLKRELTNLRLLYDRLLDRVNHLEHKHSYLKEM
jgi:hypothetical protein